MPELGPYGSVRGALSNERPYRDPDRRGACHRAGPSGPDPLAASGMTAVGVSQRSAGRVLCFSGRRVRPYPFSCAPPKREGMERADLGFTRDRTFICASRVNPTCDGARAVRYAALWRANDGGPPRTHGETSLPRPAACGVRAPNDVGRCASRGSTATRVVGAPRPAPSSDAAIDDALDERGAVNIVLRQRHCQVGRRSTRPMAEAVGRAANGRMASS